MKIRAIEYEHWWQCSDGCCTNYDTVTKFFHDNKTYQYRGHDTESNLREFLREILGIEFEYENVTEEEFKNAG